MFQMLSPFSTNSQLTVIVFDLIQFLCHVEVGTQQFVLGNVRYLFHQTDAVVECFDRLLMIDIIIDDTNLLIG